MRKLKIPRQTRYAVSDSLSVSVENRTLEVSFSSEFPVERWFGKEVLSHKASAVDLSRLNDSAPLLFNHDPNQLIGVVENAEIRNDKRGYAFIRFSKNALAEQVFNDVQDGIIRNVSFGYQIDEIEEDDNEHVFLATKWMPYEISLVSVPADPTIGVGRAVDESAKEIEVKTKNVEVMMTSANNNITDGEIAAIAKGERMQSVETGDAVKAERERIAIIQALGNKYRQTEIARQFVDNGKSADEFRQAILEHMETPKPIQKDEIDLTQKEQRNYSLIRAINAKLTGKWETAGLEKEISDEIAKRTGKDSTGFYMPLNLRAGSAGSYQVGSATLGGNLVQTSVLADSFIDLLRNKMLVASLGAQSLSGLVGNIAIPKQSAAAASYWISELADVTESEGTFAQVTMSPKTVGARSQISRHMLLQGTPDIEMLVRNDLAQVIALAIDAAAINGSGASGQPRGILQQSGIGSVAMGANGAALTNIDPLIDLETAVASANADFGSLAYITSPGQIAKLKKLKATTNEYLWNGYEAAVGAAVPGEINGYKVGRTMQIPQNLVKGSSGAVCHAMIFGNFNDLIIGQWGPGVEITANPYGAGFNNGAIDLRALASVDVAVRNAVSFAAISDLL